MIPLKLELCCAAMNVPVLYNVRVPRTIRTKEREEKAARFWWYVIFYMKLIWNVNIDRVVYSVHTFIIGGSWRALHR